MVWGEPTGNRKWESALAGAPTRGVYQAATLSIGLTESRSTIHTPDLPDARPISVML